MNRSPHTVCYFDLPNIIFELLKWTIITTNLKLKIPILGNVKSWLSSFFQSTPGNSGVLIRSLLINFKI